MLRLEIERGWKCGRGRPARLCILGLRGPVETACQTDESLRVVWHRIVAGVNQSVVRAPHATTPAINVQ